MTAQVVDNVGTNLTGIADGASGTATDNGQVISYSKTTATKYSVLVKNSAGVPYLYVDMDGANFNLKMAFDGMPADAGAVGSAPVAGTFQFSGTYTDETHWSVTAYMAGMECSSTDVAAPGSVMIKMAREGTLWKGKAMMYNPRWVGQGLTCSTTPSDSTGITMYTDFVANDAAAKAKVFLMSRAETSLADIDSFSFPNLLATYSANPGLQDMFGQAGSLAAYANPFCNSAASLTSATWNSDCTGVDSAIAAASFMAATEWIAPKTFSESTLTIPSSL
ncbi:hypothetical protein WDW86_12905 [Bdellovibrionota bacterium FG-2]